KSVDGGRSWAPANGGITYFYLSGVAVSASDPSVLYATSGYGGGIHQDIYLSHDSGATWANVTNDFPNGFAYTVAIDPADPTIAYVGSVGSPAVVYKTTNAGRHWIPAGGSIPPTESVEAIVIDPTDPQRLYIG